MRLVLPLVVLTFLALAAPAHAAASITIFLERGDGHPADHPVEVPTDTNRAKVPINLIVKAKEFVCVQPTTVSVQMFMTFSEEWAGASPDPDKATVTIAAGEPGVDGKEYKSLGALGLGIFWGENRPKTGASMVYTLTTTETTVQGPCGPPPPTPVEANYRLPAAGKDIVEETTGPINCSLTPDVPECLESPTVEAKGESPGFDPLLFTLVSLGVVYAIRSRRP